MILDRGGIRTSSQHLATVADTKGEGVGSLEEGLKGLTGTIVHEDGLGPSVTGAKDVTVQISTSQSRKRKAGNSP